MTARIIAVSIVVGPAAATALVPLARTHGWIAPALAVVLGVALALVRRRALSLVVLGVGISSLGAMFAGRASAVASVLAQSGTADAWPTYDLTDGPLPESTPPLVAIRGFFRSDWVLDEYGTPDGERPDLNQSARAVLVPLVGTTDAEIDLAGRIVIARVAEGRESVQTLETVRGRLEPLPVELLHALVQFSDNVPLDAVGGVLIDSMQIPRRRTVWIDGGLAGLCLLIAFGALWAAAGRD